MNAGTPSLFRFDNSYTRLPGNLYTRQQPTVVAQPSLLLFNHELASSLNIEINQSTEKELAELFSGNQPIPGSDPIAQAYAGHQFGNFTMLGDGRAILLGEHLTPDGRRIDIQLKGSGQTPYSRRGDGRATLRSMLREYLISEAMHHLGIPTSRSLAVVATGETVWREKPHQGAVLTRLASSHIRVGSFEYVRQFASPEDAHSFTHYVLNRHYPDQKEKEPAGLALFDAVMDRQLALIVEWMRVGFIHGVMNTDNMSISGETIDYGPCAFMNRYDPATVFSSIDTNGRYAFGNQPMIAHWNLAVLAGALLPVVHEVEEEAVALLQERLQAFLQRFKEQYETMLAAKIGIAAPMVADKDLVDRLLSWMKQEKADYTDTFRRLMMEESGGDLHPEMVQWMADWKQRITEQPGGREAALATMRRMNPIRIPRNHLVEAALDAADAGGMAPFYKLLDALQSPYDAHEADPTFIGYPMENESTYRTYCGT